MNEDKIQSKQQLKNNNNEELRVHTSRFPLSWQANYN